MEKKSLVKCWYIWAFTVSDLLQLHFSTHYWHYWRDQNGCFLCQNLELIHLHFHEKLYIMINLKLWIHVTGSKQNVWLSNDHKLCICHCFVFLMVSIKAQADGNVCLMQTLCNTEESRMYEGETQEERSWKENYNLREKKAHKTT